jgi:hypothetical protein
MRFMGYCGYPVNPCYVNPIKEKEQHMETLSDLSSCEYTVTNIIWRLPPDKITELVHFAKFLESEYARGINDFVNENKTGTEDAIVINIIRRLPPDKITEFLHFAQFIESEYEKEINDLVNQDNTGTEEKMITATLIRQLL